MKLNCDLGESFGHWKSGCDEAVMPVIDMANIACGFHAGDENHMFTALSLAKMHGVEVGAHPSYKDLAGFGRRSMPHTDQEIINLITYQVSALYGMGRSLGVDLSYVKPHGALYHDLMHDADIRFAVYRAVQTLNRRLNLELKLVMMATAHAELYRREASTFQLTLMFEAFADRRYTVEGQLQNRKVTGAVLAEPELLQQVQQLVSTGRVTTDEGTELAIAADTLCVHGDNPAAVKLIRQIRAICQG